MLNSVMNIDRGRNKSVLVYLHKDMPKVNEDKNCRFPIKIGNILCLNSKAKPLYCDNEPVDEVAVIEMVNYICTKNLADRHANNVAGHEIDEWNVLGMIQKI